MQYERYKLTAVLQFWSIYTLDIFSSISFGSIIQHRGIQSNVGYPAETVDDTEFELASTTPSTDRVSWLRGWNHTTDMYRMLEGLVDRLRAQKAHSLGFGTLGSTHLGDPLLMPGQQPVEQMLLALDSIYAELSSEFKVSPSLTGDPVADRFGFQGETRDLFLSVVAHVSQLPTSYSLGRLLRWCLPR